ncbi:hypothetical protein WICMUC_004591 [Wickerhamomyces mucosus]|uniref:RING-type E3 ubiquitin transferase n=1 Tax=Wickerhamomyces mucosus TaxID=1378264 RepID=A0A9P8PHQ7_9ASCO|nr:hypothetical protein WICMUC_004591 [Wickerhamomyces mucosus]
MSSRIRNNPTQRGSQQSSKPRKSSAKSSQQTAQSWKRTFVIETPDIEDENIDLCDICAEPIHISAISQCNHKTCHKCTLRQRALYEKKNCLICRTENATVIFTEESSKEFQDFKPSSFISKRDKKYGLEFTSEHGFEQTVGLLIYKCRECSYIANDYKEFNEHVKSSHDEQICIICASHKKEFPALIKVYTHKELQTHLIRGDEKGFDGHPSCKFCKNKRFYSIDELNAHLKRNHEKCHVCDQIDPSNPQYFKDYDSLEEHFRTDHYICNVQSCLDKKFVVFADELDLQAHMIAEHGGIYGGNNVIGASSNRFRSQLSTFPQHNNNNRASNGNASVTSLEQPDSLETKRKRLEERARHYLNYSASDFKIFLELNKSFKFGKITSQELERSFSDLFRNPESDIYLLIYEMAKIFPKQSPQRAELLSIYEKNERVSKHEDDFPALPGSSSESNGAFGAWNSTKAKKAAQKKKIAEDFPALPNAHISSSYTPVKTTVRYKSLYQPVPKSDIRVNQSTQPNYIPTYLSNRVSSSVTNSPQIKPPKINDAEFPALPQATPKRVIPRVNPIPVGNGAWDITSSTSSDSSTPPNGMDNTMPNIINKKGKKKKQILFQMGGR